jgi:hypothetical protein
MAALFLDDFLFGREPTQEPEFNKPADDKRLAAFPRVRSTLSPACQPQT